MASRRLFDGAQQELDLLPVVSSAGVVFWLHVAGAWRQAVVWIRSGGVWKRATPRIRVDGVWK